MQTRKILNWITVVNNRSTVYRETIKERDAYRVMVTLLHTALYLVPGAWREIYNGGVLLRESRGGAHSRCRQLGSGSKALSRQSTEVLERLKILYFFGKNDILKIKM